MGQKNNCRVTVKKAAEELGVSQNFVRFMMQDKKLPIGLAEKMPGSSKFTYVIIRSKLDNFIQDHGAWNSTERKEDTYETN